MAKERQRRRRYNNVRGFSSGDAWGIFIREPDPYSYDQEDDEGERRLTVARSHARTDGLLDNGVDETVLPSLKQDQQVKAYEY